MEKRTFFARYALFILIVVFFLVPFGLRGARMGLKEMKNEVKDWLPKNLQETKELDEFRRYFLSEQFVIVSWEGCFGDATDERFKMFLAKLLPETPPSKLPPADAASDAGSPPAEDAAGMLEVSHTARADAADENATAEESKSQHPARYIHQASGFIGDQLGLYTTGDWHENWGGRQEKWLRGMRNEKEEANQQCWYYITPDGDLFRWDTVDAPLATLGAVLHRDYTGEPVGGTLIHSFGPIDGPWYHADPRRLRAGLFKTITTGPDVLAGLTAPGGELSGSNELVREAKRRLAGVMFGPDGKTTCILLTLTDAARRNLHLVCGRGMLGKPRGRLFEVATETNIDDSELRLGGPPVDNVAIDEEGTITLVRLISYSAVLGIVLTLLCFRSISATIIVLFVGGISAIMSLAIVWWGGSSLDCIMMSMPSMIYVLGLSGATHIMNYYYEAVDEHGHVGAPEQAVARGWKPAFLCEATTALGLITLVTSELVPIRKFGLFAAIAVMAMFVIMLTYLPSALQIWPQQPRKKAKGGDATWLHKVLENFWEMVGGWIIRHHALVATACTLIIIAAACGIAHMKTSVNMLKMFHSEAKLIKDYAWLEQNLGRLVPMEIVVRIPKADQAPSHDELRKLHEELEDAGTTPERKVAVQRTLHEAEFQLSFLERMEIAARVQNLLEEQFGPQGGDVVGRAISAATFVRPLPKPGMSTSARLARASMSGRLEAHRDDFCHSDYLRINPDDQTELWRISLRLSGIKGVDYGAFVSELKQTVEPVIAAQHERQEILRRLDLQGESAEGQEKSSGNRRVLLVGVPAGSVGRQKPATEVEQPAEGEATAPGIDQKKIFARTLVDLLTAARLRVDAVSAQSSETPENLQKALASYDCVVLIDEVPGLELPDIRQGALTTIDARHHFLKSSGEAQTAWQRDPTAIAAVYTGIVPIVYKAQRLLLDSLLQSTFWSILTITPLLMWIARSFSAGAVAMLPNVLPIFMVFGGMGWLGIEVDVGAMMTASIALGVAVDDTIHYLNWFRAELDRVGDRKKAILAAYRHCATPTVQAAIISGLGLSIFALSTFTPTQRFGILMLVILWLGAVAELIYFPALLAGPLGLFFKPRKEVNLDLIGRRRADGSHAPTSAPQLQVVHGEAAATEPALAVFPPQSKSEIHPRQQAVGKPNFLLHLREDAPTLQE